MQKVKILKTNRVIEKFMCKPVIHPPTGYHAHEEL